MNQTICIDFDGVIHSYMTPWESADIIPDPPVPGAFPFLVECMANGFQVAIFSTRSLQDSGITAMMHWFLRHGFSEARFFTFPSVKPPAILYIDDRAFLFEGRFPSITYINCFRPWNKRKHKPDNE